jgi:nucleotide-binding universal stress UspA family protein
VYQQILVPIDGSETAQRGLREAISLAADQHARLHLLHVVDTTPLYLGLAPAVGLEHSVEVMKQDAEALVGAARREAAEAGVWVASAILEIGTERVADHILAEAGRCGADLIVMGTHGRRGFNRLALGSDAETVARESPVPVLLVRGRDPQP